jgi:hypothetical protein
MAGPIQFAVLQQEFAGVSADHLKRAFSAFVNLTDMDAVRLAAGARGILMRQMNRDSARALQSALAAEGVSVVIVRENDLPRLPEGKALHRVELSDQAFIVYDLLGRQRPIDWTRISLVAVGLVGRFGFARTLTERTELRFNAVSGVWPKKSTEVGHKLEWDATPVLELLVGAGEERYQIEATEFPFKYVIDQPDLSPSDKFLWLVREICRRSTGAILNHGARAIHSGEQSVLEYHTRQALADEMVWLMWNESRRFGVPPSGGTIQ